MASVGKVYLIGAGPGDPELLTLRGRRRLHEADLVLYDALVHPDLLRHCRPDAERIFVGKRAGRAHERQVVINQRLVDAAQAGRTVARLKGGDPYLFGRGSEEAEVLARAGIRFEVVPGVPSPLAATAYAGISLTHRELASSVAYITATESPEKDASAHDWSKLATATQTLVIFMGLRRLDSLMKRLIAHGRSPDCPAAVVQSASLPLQRTVVGTVGDIADAAHRAGMQMPALTIVGDVVHLREQLRWYDRQPLFGKRVLITRPSHQSQGFAVALRDAGAEPLEWPAVRIAPPDDTLPLRHAVEILAHYHWVVCTSMNGVTALFDELRRQSGDARRLGTARVVAIGPATAESFVAQGVQPDLIAAEHTGEGVIDVMQAHAQRIGVPLAGQRILLPRAAEAREVIPEGLRQLGAAVDVIPAYRAVPPTQEAVESLRIGLAAREIDIVTFTASSTVRHFLEAIGPDRDALLPGVTLASIGPITTQTAEAAGLHVDVTARTYTTRGLLDALVAHFASETDPR